MQERQSIPARVGIVWLLGILNASGISHMLMLPTFTCPLAEGAARAALRGTEAIRHVVDGLDSPYTS